MTLEAYNRKRKFSQTPEPPGKKAKGQGPLRFVVQMHAASRLHYDFRIEADGALKSWAIPKGPSLNVQDQRLAVQVEDHPIPYGDFEGIIPKGNYGAGTVMVWDEGTYLERSSKTREESEKAILKGLAEGHVTLLLEGEKLQGEFALIRLKKDDAKSWLLVKKRDEFASRQDVTKLDRSVKTGRTLEEIRIQAPTKGEVWLPARGTPPEEEVKPHRSRKPAPGRASNSSPDSLGPSSSKTSESIPRRIKPMLATPAPEAFDQTGWIFELDRGGHRAIAELENGVVHLYSRQLLPFEKKYLTIVESLRKFKGTAVVDGEIEIKSDAPVYWVRDLLHLNGNNLRNLALIERKRLLEKLSLFDDRVRYCSHQENQGIAFFNKAATENEAHILARNAFSSYQSGTSKDWLKIEVKTKSEKGPRLTHLDKLYWNKEEITKGDLIDYYRQIAPLLLPHLKDRPESLHRHPNGIENEGFFQKDLIGHHPRFVQTTRIFSESSDKSIDYLLCQNESTLLYMANLGCIEINPWLSRVGSLDKPDSVVIDLDPDDNDFSEVIKVALEFHHLLDKIGADHYCKTSGATGLHIAIPLQAQVDYETAREFVLSVCRVIHQKFPNLTSLERNPQKRRGKIYLDCFQNAEGQTLASVYSVRPRPGATVSTPLLWKELVSSLRPEKFTIRTLPERLQKLGDLWKPILTESIDLEKCRETLKKKFPSPK